MALLRVGWLSVRCCVLLFVLMSFSVFKMYFSSFVFVCLSAAVYGVIKNNNNIPYTSVGLLVGLEEHLACKN